MGKKSEKKSKSRSGKAKLKSLGRNKAIKKIMKKAESLLEEHGLSWGDLPIAKHFASEPAPAKKPAAAKRATRSISKPATKTAAKPAANAKSTRAASSRAGKSSAAKAVPAASKKPAARRTTKAAVASSAARSTKAPAARKTAAKKPAAARKAVTRKPAAKPARARTSTKMPPKYRNPKDASQTWAGRGPKPAWLREFIESGGTLEQALIKK